ncbi:MAG TPA: YebG family protein [Marinobacter sp.]|nr:YebG family protein [Marinobacter sp.]
MAVKAIYYSDRDGLEMALKNPDTMIFASKSEADARDRQLELAEELREFLIRRVEGLEEDLADRVAMTIAEHQDLIAKGLKKPGLLNQAGPDSQ